MPSVSPGKENTVPAHAGSNQGTGQKSTTKVVDLRRGDRSAWQWLLGELALALPPTGTLVLALFTTHELTHNPVLFTSLASSAFLIYRDPTHRMNSVRIMSIAQATGAICGIIATLLLGHGYLTVAAAVLATIIILVPLNAVHPPGISTAMGFALLPPHDGLVISFAIAVGLIVILAVLQQAAARTLDWMEAQTGVQHR